MKTITLVNFLTGNVRTIREIRENICDLEYNVTNGFPSHMPNKDKVAKYATSDSIIDIYIKQGYIIARIEENGILL